MRREEIVDERWRRLWFRWRSAAALPFRDGKRWPDPGLLSRLGRGVARDGRPRPRRRSEAPSSARGAGPPSRPALVGAGLGLRERALSGGLRLLVPAASLPSFAAFVFTPPAAFLLARRLAPVGLLATAATASPSSRPCSCDRRCCWIVRLAHAREPRRVARRSLRGSVSRGALRRGCVAGAFRRRGGALLPEVPLRILRALDVRRRRALRGDTRRADDASGRPRVRLLAARSRCGTPRPCGGSRGGPGVLSKHGGEILASRAPRCRTSLGGPSFSCPPSHLRRRRASPRRWMAASGTFRDSRRSSASPPCRMVSRSRERARLVPPGLPAHGRARAESPREARGVRELSEGRLDARLRTRGPRAFRAPPRALLPRRGRAGRSWCSWSGPSS